MIRILLSKKLGELKWTQADLARATGIRPTTISDYYNEIAERMNLNHLDLICEALDCEPDEILVRVPNPEPRVRNRTGFEKPANQKLVYKGKGGFRAVLFLLRDICMKQMHYNNVYSS